MPGARTPATRTHRHNQEKPGVLIRLELRWGASPPPLAAGLAGDVVAGLPSDATASSADDRSVPAPGAGSVLRRRAGRCPVLAPLRGVGLSPRSDPALPALCLLPPDRVRGVRAGALLAAPMIICS